MLQRRPRSPRRSSPRARTGRTRRAVRRGCASSTRSSSAEPLVALGRRGADRLPADERRRLLLARAAPSAGAPALARDAKADAVAARWSSFERPANSQLAVHDDEHLLRRVRARPPRGSRAAAGCAIRTRSARGSLLECHLGHHGAWSRSLLRTLFIIPSAHGSPDGGQSAWKGHPERTAMRVRSTSPEAAFADGVARRRAASRQFSGSSQPGELCVWPARMSNPLLHIARRIQRANPGQKSANDLN